MEVWGPQGGEALNGSFFGFGVTRSPSLFGARSLTAAFLVGVLGSGPYSSRLQNKWVPLFYPLYWRTSVFIFWGAIHRVSVSPCSLPQGKLLIPHNSHYGTLLSMESIRGSLRKMLNPNQDPLSFQICLEGEVQVAASCFCSWRTLFKPGLQEYGHGSKSRTPSEHPH